MIRKVDDNEYQKWMKLYNSEYFTNKEIINIKSLFIQFDVLFFKRLNSINKNTGSVINFHGMEFKENVDNHINHLYILSKDTTISIDKKEDEWFLIDINDKKYLIDGFDSLISFIKEIILND